MKGKTISQAAQEIGVSRPLVHYALNDRPLGKQTALKVERWSGGFLRAVDLMQIYEGDDNGF